VTTTSRKTTKRTISPAEQARRDADRQAKVEAAHTLLTEGIANLTNSTQWTAMLTTAARFHHYSWRNCLMILSQREDATRVAGYKTWQALGRQVRKGEPGIKIWAHITVWRDPKDSDPADTIDPKTGKVRRDGYRIEHVWDIAQTDGDPLPDTEQPRPTLLTGDAPDGLWDALAAQVTALGYTLRRAAHPSSPDANGTTDPRNRTVYVRPDLNPAQAVKTLAHEIAHIRCGHTDPGQHTPRTRGEVEAESVAFVVASYFGLDTSDYTLAYVAGWAEDGKETEAVTETADTVIRVARQIIDDAEEHMTPDLPVAVGQ